MQEQRQLRFFLTVLNTFIVFFLLWVSFRYLFWWLLPFGVAAGFAALIEAPVSFSQKHLRIPRALASGIFTLLAFFALGGAIWFICTKILAEVRDLLLSLPDAETLQMEAARFLQWLSHRLPGRVSDVLFRLFETIVTEGIRLPQGLTQALGSGAARFAAALPSLLFATFISILATYFFSADKDALFALLRDLLPQNWKKVCSNAKRAGLRMAGGYLRAMLLMLSLIFALLAVGLGILKIRYAVGLAFLIALLDAIPVFGVGTALIPWAFARLLRGDVSGALGLLALYLVALLVRNLVEPKVLGAQLGLHPAVTLIAFYLGLRIFGPLGIFLPVPVCIGLNLWKKKTRG